MPRLWLPNPLISRQEGEEVRPNFLDSKLIAKRLGMAVTAVVTAYTMGALMMAGIAVAGYEYSKCKNRKSI